MFRSMTEHNGAKQNPDWTWDELILACDLVASNEWRPIGDADPRVIELSALLQRGPTPMSDQLPTFRNPNGVGRKTSDIATSHPDYPGVPTHGSRLDLVVLEAFRTDPVGMHKRAVAIRQLFASGEALTLTPPAVPDPMEDVAADEGEVLVRKHLQRERKKGLRDKKIQQLVAAGLRIACETCGLDPADKYGDLADPKTLVDVHHVLPLSVSGKTQTRLQDLAVLCPSCHRAIHAARPWLTPDELRTHLTKPSRSSIG